jgi:hypothetical protein
MEIGFAKTVGAECKVREMMHNHGDDVNLFTDKTPYWEARDIMAEFMVYMHDGYIAKMRLEALQTGKAPEKENHISKEDFLSMEEEAFDRLFIKAADVFKNDGRTVFTKSENDAKKKE